MGRSGMNRLQTLALGHIGKLREEVFGLNVSNQCADPLKAGNKIRENCEKIGGLLVEMESWLRAISESKE